MRIESVPLSFMSRTDPTASCATSCVFGHDSGSVNVLEKTIFCFSVRASIPGSPSAARSNMSL